jgi:hypothetical protein
MHHASLLLMALAVAVSADCSGFPYFTVNYTFAGCDSNTINVNCGQNGWGGFYVTDPTERINTLVQTPPAPLVLTGNGALHIDNQVTSGGFGFQPDSALADQKNTWAGAIDLAGTTSPADAPYGGNTMEFEFDLYFVSAVADGYFTSLSLWSNVLAGGGDRGTYLALENAPNCTGGCTFPLDGARVYTLDNADGTNPQEFRLNRQQWYHVLYRCTWYNSTVPTQPCETHVDGALAIKSGSLASNQPFNYLQFRVSRDPSFYSLPIGGSKGVQIDNFEMRIYNISLPSQLATDYSTGFEVCPANVDGCQQNAARIQNGGTCTLPGGTALGSNGAFTVTCPSGFVGQFCQYVDGCASSPCQHNGTCSTGLQGNATCNCTADWAGPTCASANPCLSAPCANGGTCAPTNTGTAFTCACPPHFVGLTCSTSGSVARLALDRVVEIILAAAVALKQIVGYLE